MEIWKDIPGYEGLYQVSNMGRVKSFHKIKNLAERIRKPQNVGQGYHQVILHKEGEEKSHYIHALVLGTFIGNHSKGIECNHLNGDKKDNRFNGPSR